MYHLFLNWLGLFWNHINFEIDTNKSGGFRERDIWSQRDLMSALEA